MSYDCGAERCDRDDRHEHNLDDHECDECEEAYPHSVLLEKHIVDDHPETVKVDPPSAGVNLDA